MIWVVEQEPIREKHLDGQWEEFFIQSGYEFKLIKGSRQFITEKILGDSFRKSSQIQEIIELIHSEYISPGDIILFLDGWNYGVIPIKYILKTKQIDVKLIGVIGDSIFSEMYNTWPKLMYKGVRDYQDWARYFEKGILQSYDWIAFRDNTIKSNMFFRYKNLMFYQHWFVTGLPFEYIYREGKGIEFERKENIVLFPWKVSDDHLRYFEAMAGDFPDWQFIVVEDHDVNRSKYLELLSRAKILFLAKKDDINIISLYESLCYGCHPFIPDTAKYKKIFGPRYRYPKEVLESKHHISFLRKRLALQDKMQEIMDSFNLLRDDMDRDAEEIKDKLFLEWPFKQLLENANTEFPMGREISPQITF